MNSKQSGHVRFDVEKFKRARLARGMSPTELFAKANVTGKTGYNAANGKKVRVGTAAVLARAMGFEDLNDLLQGQETSFDALPHDALGLPNEWIRSRPVSPSMTASNGLQFRVYELQHSTLPDELARGKCFDLGNVASRKEAELRENLLVRHPRVCRVLAPTNYFPINQSVAHTASGSHLWVIDTWPKGTSLSQLATPSGIAIDKLPKIMRHVARALAILHAQGIVLRDLKPDSVYYDLATDRLTVVDCELAKLHDGSPTVVDGELLENPFRAPECIGHKIDATADLYSWAQLLTFAATGQVPPATGDASIISVLNMPKQLKTLAESCLQDSYRLRPESIERLIPNLDAWCLQ